jgi:hypothetical protein
MEEGSADLIVVSGSNLGRLHPDFPMDPSTDRFERKLLSNMDRLGRATDQIDGVVKQYELTHSELDLGRARDAIAGVQGFMDDVINMMKDARLEVADECAQQIRVSEWELSQIGTRLNRALLASAITPTRTPAAPADPADGGFWLPRQTMSQLQSNIDVMSSP